MTFKDDDEHLGNWERKYSTQFRHCEECHSYLCKQLLCEDKLERIESLFYEEYYIGPSLKIQRQRTLKVVLNLLSLDPLLEYQHLPICNGQSTIEIIMRLFFIVHPQWVPSVLSFFFSMNVKMLVHLLNYFTLQQQIVQFNRIQTTSRRETRRM